MNDRAELLDGHVDARRGVPRWFWIVAILGLAFEAIGVLGLIADWTTKTDQLPIDQQAMRSVKPAWLGIAYGAATLSGLAGTLLLLLRRRAAEPVLLVSLIAAIVTFLPYAVVPAVAARVRSADIVAAIVVMAICLLLYAFSRIARQHGWLA